MSALKSIAYILGLPLLLLGLWWALTLGETNFYVPTPAVLFETFGEVWFSGRFLTDVLPSLARMTAGLLAAIVIGIVIGLAVGSIPRLRALLEPLMEFLRAIPPPVLIPVLMLIMGISDEMKIVTIVFGCIWPVLLNTVEGVRAVDSVLSDSTRTYGISRWPRIWHLVLPSASPQIMAGVRQSLSLRADPDGHLRDVRLILRTGIHHRPVPAVVRDPRDVVRDRAAGPDRRRPVLHFPRSRAQRPALVPRSERSRECQLNSKPTPTRFGSQEHPCCPCGA